MSTSTLPPHAGALDALPASGIRAIAAAAWATADAVHLEFGEPDFDTPEHIVRAGFEAAAGGATRYGPSAGLPQLREGVCAKLARDNQIPAARPEQILVTAGGVGALAHAYRAVLEPGSELLVPDPGWPNLATIAQLVGAVPVRYPLRVDAGYQPDLAELETLRTANTRAIVVNSPSNPLGTVWSADVMQQVGDWARRHDLWVISDECYDQLWLQDPTTTFSLAAPDSAVITVFSLSKSYAMTGWRIGYAYGPAEIIARMTRIQETQASCVSTPTQHAALAALTGPQQALTQMRAAYRSRRDLAVADARRLGLQVEPPTGAFYLWLTLPPEAGDSTTFALQLLSETGVAVAPGAAFGPAGEGHLRVSLAAAEADLRHGLKQIAGLLADHGQLTAVSTVDDLPPQPAAPAPDAPTPRRSRCCVADHH